MTIHHNAPVRSVLGEILDPDWDPPNRKPPIRRLGLLEKFLILLVVIAISIGVLFVVSGVDDRISSQAASAWDAAGDWLSVYIPD